MAKKTFRLRYDSPVTLTFALVSAAAFSVDFFFLNGSLVKNILTCPGTKALGDIAAFNFSNPADYAKTILHVFGTGGWENLLTTLTFVLLLGPTLEERYGSPMLALMMGITAFVTGVLTACAVPVPSAGAGSIVFMMILLESLLALAKKDIPLSWLMIFLLYISYRMYTAAKIVAPVSKGFMPFLTANVPTFVDLAGGVCGSLFAFLVAPKKRNAPRKAEKTEVRETGTPASENRAGDKKNYSSDDETVVGSINL
ncbi:rhomboid family intramembrane serine protease [uncultured Treponema sp.]|uniref:rhomboid family intramembrane serine protease n=1 Tax=uncultured Treponema sp. TaxID=162155 RepID=UPI0027D9CB6C|nr:rhomboid family intramembrane serine protease [uncultured Treponema sp.]